MCPSSNNKEKDEDCKNSKASYGHSTRVIHTGHDPNHWTHSPVIPPLYMTTTYETLEPGKALYEYSRSANPTRHQLEQHLRALENAKYALVFSSGLGALTTTSYLLKSGQHVICCDDVYGGTNRFFSKCLPRMGIQTTFVNGTQTEDWVKAFQVGKTKMLWIESPTNPTMKIMDIAKIVEAVKSLDPECLVVVDNTFMTPILQSPLKMGADVVMHSCTKYINGHSDVMMGTLITNNKEIYSQLVFLQNSLGIISSPFDCSQVIRSIKTLGIRIERQCASAMAIATFLDSHQQVQQVLYPGLTSHPQHELAIKQYKSGFGGIITLRLSAPTGDEGIKFLKSVKVFHAAVSFGCFCSYIQIPSLMTHSAVSEEVQKKLGLDNNLLRLSVGLENVEDLIGDLKQALAKVYSSLD